MSPLVEELCVRRGRIKVGGVANFHCHFLMRLQQMKNYPKELKETEVSRFLNIPKLPWCATVEGKNLFFALFAM